ncbi:MAG TPA: hypothetical protein VMF66_06370 [Candidatus Acidoferrum sp.]|nr:hypothetical protein [Candidatus Acidoferrum sp.]
MIPEAKTNGAAAATEGQGSPLPQLDPLRLELCLAYMQSTGTPIFRPGRIEAGALTCAATKRKPKPQPSEYPD